MRGRWAITMGVLLLLAGCIQSIPEENLDTASTESKAVDLSDLTPGELVKRQLIVDVPADGWVAFHVEGDDTWYDDGLFGYVATVDPADGAEPWVAQWERVFDWRPTVTYHAVDPDAPWIGWLTQRSCSPQCDVATGYVLGSSGAPSTFHFTFTREIMEPDEILALPTREIVPTGNGSGGWAAYVDLSVDPNGEAREAVLGPIEMERTPGEGPADPETLALRGAVEHGTGVGAVDLHTAISGTSAWSFELGIGELDVQERGREVDTPLLKHRGPGFDDGVLDRPDRADWARTGAGESTLDLVRELHATDHWTSLRWGWSTADLQSLDPDAFGDADMDERSASHGGVVTTTDRFLAPHGADAAGSQACWEETTRTQGGTTTQLTPLLPC